MAPICTNFFDDKSVFILLKSNKFYQVFYFIKRCGFKEGSDEVLHSEAQNPVLLSLSAKDFFGNKKV